MPIEAFVKFSVEYRPGKSIDLKVSRLERTSIDHTYPMDDIIQRVISYASQNYSCGTVKEIVDFICNEIEDILAVEAIYPNGAGFTVYTSTDS